MSTTCRRFDVESCMRIVRTPSIDSVSCATIGCDGSSALRDDKRGQRADDADAEPFVNLIGPVQPAIAELQVGDADAGQGKPGQPAQGGNGIMLHLVDAACGAQPAAPS